MTMNRLPSIAHLMMSPPDAPPLDKDEMALRQTSSTLPSLPSSSQQQRHHSPHEHAPSTPFQTTSNMATPPNSQRQRQQQKMRELPSPPISPWMNKQMQGEIDENAVGVVTGQAESRYHQGDGSTDPVLFDDVGESHEPTPLFATVSMPPVHKPLSATPLHQQKAKTTGDLIDRHIAMHMVQFKNKLDKPSRDEYRLALSCVPVVGALYNQNPGAYMKRQRDEMEDLHWQTKKIRAEPMSREEYDGLHGSQPGLQRRKGSAGALTAMPSAQLSRALRPALPSAAHAPFNQAARAPVKIKRAHKVSPIAKLMQYPDKSRSSTTPDRAPGTKREDVDYASLPDYSPSTSTLPSNNPRILKADWPSSTVLDLSRDPDRHLLHEAEVHLAATLRLSCATYLCSKRRIFEARVRAIKVGKEFRKTDAQQACKIDVNKASKLWTAFDRIGWFRRDLFEQFVDRV